MWSVLDQLSSTVCFSSAPSLEDDWIQTSLFGLPASLIMQPEHSNPHMKLTVSVGFRWSCQKKNFLHRTALMFWFRIHFVPSGACPILQKLLYFPDVSQAAWPHQNRRSSAETRHSVLDSGWLFPSEVYMSWKKMDCRIKQSVKLICLLGLRAGWMVLCSCKQSAAGYKDDGLPHFSTNHRRTDITFHHQQ